ncbi:MAG: hypothetical protein L3J86_04215, partial [Thermoplasmata archaeon]|nr:hypothetical protein [Thermoplasmata archaeon]
MLGKRGILRRHHGSDTLEEGTFLDLGAMQFDDESLGGTRSTIRMAEILRYEDLHNATKIVYQGDIVIIDYTSIANDQNAVRRMSVELKNVS